MATTLDPIEFARASALSAFDQRNSFDYPSPRGAYNAYLGNIVDTLAEYGMSHLQSDAVDAYHAEYNRLEALELAKEKAKREKASAGKPAGIREIPFHHVEKDYRLGNPDGHWFDPETLRFFRCRLPGFAYATAAGLLFVTSEKPDHDTPRRYTVRRQRLSGDIVTVGQFQQYATRAQALAAIKRLHAEHSAV